MRKQRRLLGGLAALVSPWMLGGGEAQVQQVRGASGAPIALMFPDSQQLPVPPLTGQIGPDARAGTLAWPPRIAAPEDAPHVPLILTNGVGYGAFSSFGGIISPPPVGSIAEAELRYTSFHTTALWSPTRAALLTGRNAHCVGFGIFSELSTDSAGTGSA